MTRSSWVRLGVLAGIWGSSFLLIKLALEGLSPTQIVLGRLTAGAFVLLGVVALRRERLPRAPRTWAHLAVVGTVGNILPFFLFAWGEERITSGLAGVLNGTTPLFTLAFAVLALNEEPLTWARLVGLVLGFAGVVVVVGPWSVSPLTSSVPGQLACLGAAACYGVAFVYTRRFITGRGSPLALAAAQLTAAMVLLGMVSPFVARQPMRLELLVVASVALLGAVGTGLAYLLFYRLIHDASATTASMVTYLIPVVAVLLGWAVLGEPIGWNLYVGAAVVLLGVATAEGRVRLPVARARQTAVVGEAGAADSGSAVSAGRRSRRRPRGRGAPPAGTR